MNQEKASDKASEQLSAIDPATNGAAKKSTPRGELTYTSKRMPRLLERAVIDLIAKDKKTAQGVIASGYAELAEPIHRDIAELEYQVLPQVRAQRELPLVSYDDLEKRVYELVEGPTRSGFAGLDEKGAATKAALKSRTDRTTRAVSQRMASLLSNVAKAAYAAGFAERYRTPEGLVVEQITALTGRAD